MQRVFAAWCVSPRDFLAEIVVTFRVSLFPEHDNDNWVASLGTAIVSDPNPLRAAAIVFLATRNKQ